MIGQETFNFEFRFLVVRRPPFQVILVFVFSYFFGTIRQTVIWHTGNPTNTKENPADSKNVWPDSNFHSQVYSKFKIRYWVG